MKRIPYLILLLMFLTSCGHSQTSTLHDKLTGNLKSDLKLLLPNGTIEVDIMDGVRQDPRQLELSKNFNLP
ncbi:hypothetical protein [Pedobacter panaciterrae]